MIKYLYNQSILGRLYIAITLILFTISIKGQSYSQLTDSLKVYYDLNEISGNAFDKLGVANSYSVDATQGVDGKLGKAYLFNGSSSLVSVLDNPIWTINTTDSLTISAWINFTDDNLHAWGNIVGSYAGWCFQVKKQDPKLYSLIWYTGLSVSFSMEFNIVPGTWYHVVMVKEGDRIIKFYLNNVLISSVQPNDRFIDPAAFYIGGNEAGEYFNGKIDEVGIWRRVLSDTEVGLLYNSGNGLNYPFSLAEGTPISPSFIYTVNKPGQVDIIWNDNSDNEDGFILEQAIYPSDLYTEVARVGSNITSYSHFVPAIICSYRICSYTASSKSDYIATKWVSTQLFKPDLTENGEILTSEGESPSYEEKEMAFDNDCDTKWLIKKDTAWIQYNFHNEDSFIVNSYTLSSANDFGDRDPKDWKLQGSIDGDIWVDLDTRTNIDFQDRFQTKRFYTTNNQYFRKYRLLITANHGDPFIQLSEIQLEYVSNKITINTENLGTNYIYSLTGDVIDIDSPFESGTSNSIKLKQDTSLIAMKQIIINFKSKNNVEDFLIKLKVTSDGEIRDVLTEISGNYLPLNNNFFTIKSSEISIHANLKLLKGNVYLIGTHGIIKIPDQSVSVMGLPQNTNTSMMIFKSINQTIPIRTITGSLLWDGKDSYGNNVIPGVYILSIHLNDGSGKVLNNQIIVK